MGEHQELTLAAFTDLTALEAGRRELDVESTQRDGIVYVRIQPRPNEVHHDRQEVTISTYGTGVFSLDLDERWTWQAISYDRDDQIEIVQDLVDAAERYLCGEGQEESRQRKWRKPETVFVLIVDGEKVSLRARK